MRVCIIGEVVSKRTGFGKQTKYLCEGLASKGHEVHLIGLGGLKNDKIISFQQWTCPYFNVSEIDNLLCIIKPDVIISFTFLGHQAALMQSVAMACNVPCYFWTPWEGVTLPRDADKMFPYVDSSKFIHLSKYALNLWQNIIGNSYIYHGIDLNTFKVIEDFNLRKKWSARLKKHLQETVIIAVERNDARKRWDLIFDYIRRLIDGKIPVQLIAVVWPKVFPEMGYDLPNLAKVYGIQDHVIFTDSEGVGEITDSDLAELYNLSNFRVSMSSGEGFGLGTIEAMACGCVNVCPENTTFKELAGPACVKDVALEPKFDSLWAIPNVHAMTHRTSSMILSSMEVKKLRDWGLDEVKKFDVNIMIDAWDELIRTPQTTEPWYTNRFGYARTGLRLNQLQVWSNVLKALTDGYCIQPFSFDGKFIDFARAYGVKLIGIESDPKCIPLMSYEAKTFTLHGSVFDVWPNAECAVLIDCLDYVQMDLRVELLKKLTLHKWSIVRFNRTYKFDHIHTTSSEAEKIMKELKLYRREDLERMIVSKLKLSDLGGLQIWQNHQDTTVIPPGFR